MAALKKPHTLVGSEFGVWKKVKIHQKEKCSMGGTIRCKHGFRLVEAGIIGQTGYENQVVVLQPADELPGFYGSDDLSLTHKTKSMCETTIPRSMYDNITKNGGNFTHVIFKDKSEMDAYKQERSDMFRFVSSASSILPDGRYHMIH